MDNDCVHFGRCVGILGAMRGRGLSVALVCVGAKSRFWRRVKNRYWGTVDRNFGDNAPAFWTRSYLSRLRVLNFTSPQGSRVGKAGNRKRVNVYKLKRGVGRGVGREGQ